MEEWREIPEWEGFYEVSNLGNVRSMARTVIGVDGKPYSYTSAPLQPWRHKSGHLYVGFRRDTNRVNQQVHRLVMLTFVGPCPLGMEVCHNNGIHDDNRLENLRYGTRRENIDDMRLHGLLPRGSQKASAKLSEEEVLDILSRLTLGKGGNTKELAEEYGIATNTITRIVNGDRWGWLTKEWREKNARDRPI